MSISTARSSRRSPDSGSSIVGRPFSARPFVDQLISCSARPITRSYQRPNWTPEHHWTPGGHHPDVQRIPGGSGRLPLDPCPISNARMLPSPPLRAQRWGEGVGGVTSRFTARYRAVERRYWWTPGGVHRVSGCPVGPLTYVDGTLASSVVGPFGQPRQLFRYDRPSPIPHASGGTGIARVLLSALRPDRVPAGIHYAIGNVEFRAPGSLRSAYRVSSRRAAWR